MQNLNKYLIAIAFITSINAFISTRFMKAHREMYHNHYKEIAFQNKDLSERYPIKTWEEYTQEYNLRSKECN